MTWVDHEATFKDALRELSDFSSKSWKMADAFSTRTAARVLTDGLLIGIYNLNRISPGIEQLLLSTLLRTFPGDDILLSFRIGSGLPIARARLTLMGELGTEQPVSDAVHEEVEAYGDYQLSYSKSNSYVAVYLASDGHIYLHNNGAFPHEIGDHLSLLEPAIPLDSIYIGVYPPKGAVTPSTSALEAVVKLEELVGESKVVHLGSWTKTLTPDIEPVDAKILLQLVSSFQSALTTSGLRIPETRSRAFLTALATKRFAILTGLSGSGKTQIALRLGDWFGKDRSLLVPVRPDWTGPEPLLGYEDGLAAPNEEGKRPYHTPDVLQFILKAADDRDHPYLLILDEMNLAHVERYFADILSGLESDQPVIPNIVDGYQEGKLPLPTNLFIVGTVNVDETTYMFSPKVLDRANTFEFRVETDDLILTESRPTAAPAGDEALVRGFLAIAREATDANRTDFAEHFKTLHRLLAAADWEFGHRVFYEANRFAALLAAAGEDSLDAALDAQLMQKILPRLHGNRRRLEPTLCALGRFCLDLTYEPDADQVARYKALMEPKPTPRLAVSHAKIERMLRNLRTNQFASFTE